MFSNVSFSPAAVVQLSALKRLSGMALMFVFATSSVCAQSPVAPSPTTPSAEQMIEQLRKPKTRSFRNLSVEQAPVATDGQPVAVAIAQPKPSLSLLIQFEFGSAKVATVSKAALVNLAQALKSRDLATSKFAVEGHTDAQGAPAYNQKLSANRAEAVKAFLMAQQIEGDRLVASGKGSTELANPQDPKASENRRVRIVNLD